MYNRKLKITVTHDPPGTCETPRLKLHNNYLLINIVFKITYYD